MNACLEGLRLGQEAEWTSATAVGQHLLCRLLFDDGEIAEAIPFIAKCLVTFWETGDYWNLTQALELAAPIVAAGDQAESAARLLGAVAALREAMPFPVGAGEHDTLARWQAEVRAALGEATFAQAWSTGKEQPLDASVAEARAVLATMTG